MSDDDPGYSPSRIVGDILGIGAAVVLCLYLFPLLLCIVAVVAVLFALAMVAGLLGGS